MAPQGDPISASDLATFWILFGKHGPTMTIDQFRAESFPSTTMKTMRNKLAARQLPTRTGEVFDTRDVADWWDRQRTYRVAQACWAYAIAARGPMNSDYSRSSLSQATVSFLDAKAAAEALLDLYAQAGVSLNPLSSLGRMIEQAISNADLLESNQLDRLDNAALLRGQQLSRIARAALPLADVPDRKQHLLDLKRDALDPWDRSLSRGKNKLWELELWTLLNERGAPSELIEPDIVARTNSGVIAIACKRIYSLDNARSSMAYGIKQLATKGETSLLAVCLDDVVVDAGKVIVAPSIDLVVKYLDRKNQEFLDAHAIDLSRYMTEGRAACVLASSSSPVFLSDEERLVDCQQMTFWHHPGAPEALSKHMAELDLVLQPGAFLDTGI